MSLLNNNNLLKICKSSNLWVLIVVFILIFTFFNFKTVSADEDINLKILDLREQIEKLEKEAEQYKGTIKAKSKEADTLARQISILNNQMSQLRVQLAVTDRSIDATKLEMTELNEQIFNTQEALNFEKKAIGNLISEIHQNEKQSMLAVLLKNARLSDFFGKTQENEKLSAQLTKLLSTLKTQKIILDGQLNSLKTKKGELEGLKEQQIRQNISLESTKENKDYLLTKTKGEEARYRDLLAEVERKEQEFFNELQSLEKAALEEGAFIVHVTADPIPPKANIFRWPEDNYVFTQGYGYTTYARRGAYGGAPHNGIDFAGGYGTPIYAMGEGTILASGFNDGFGNWVAIRYFNNLVSVYAHMQSPSGLSNTTPVHGGSIVGYEGSTGNSTGSHLHLSLYHDFFTYINEKNGQIYFNYFDGTLNPLDYLP
ncbi:MAG: hypothetical protein COV29_01510 [Candidatus Yanofskybacteria bacterium CG10_big_fil_rev_8_21_14_0_10_36_16]|uniref:M23ase beta-sheet core domain-containing protein n=1 Tax=Candidatus Yanofskybacteria bacterium CG10_big_fil_rev_8_21_14_0_10_36_16 TaxID=1975096 RepID=A0A2J0Q793_9BACT|nr:MAG: hypothetical protein COV29_01510 [Candidatus Yanofskybacteria bacterium CG10_big_fil_rev_8_21_14_0_10_36_16]